MLNIKFNSLHPMDMGKRIAHARKTAGLKPAELARRVGVSKGAVSQWEDGTVKDLRLPNLFAIEDATGFSARWIALEEGPERISDLHPATLGERVDELDYSGMARLLRVVAAALEK